jgi:hypothetical protein
LLKDAAKVSAANGIAMALPEVVPQRMIPGVSNQPRSLRCLKHLIVHHHAAEIMDYVIGLDGSFAVYTFLQ